MGAIVAGPIVRDACARHLRDLAHGHKRGLRWSEERANYALDYFPIVLRLNGGDFEGKPFHLEPPQQFIVGSLFGWLMPDGTRRFQTAYIEMGKGNGKSPLVAGIGMICLTSDGEARAEVYAAATKKDQAMVLFRDAVAMYQQSPALTRALRHTGRGEKIWRLYHPESGGFFSAITSDDGQSGPRPSCALLDEIHEHKNANMIEMMRAGFKTRRQPLLIMITNSGHDRESVCWQRHEYARDVNSGVLADDRFFGFVCSLDKNDDPLVDERCWPKANPLLGKTIKVEYLRDQVREARGMPSKEAVVRRLNFCEWTEVANPAINRELWDAAEAKFTLEKFRGRDVFLGIDLSATTDLTAIVIVYVDDRGMSWWWPLFWMPEHGLGKRAKEDKVPYDVWKKKGWLYTVPGKTINKDFVVAQLALILDEYELNVIEAAYDKARIEEFKASLSREGLELPLKEFQQGFISMGPAVEAFEKSLIDETVRHNGSPVMRWGVAHAVAIEDPAGNRKFDKSASRVRIDGVVAAAMAHFRSIAQIEQEGMDDFLNDPVIG